jgi:SAM-dependent methyltransferase
VNDAVRYDFYGELASWWPLISPVDDYAEEAAFAATVLRRAAIDVREVLELGSGGGSNAVHLEPQFTMTLSDLSEAMLDVSRARNPGCAHHAGDMRSVRLGRQFDAVFVHDAIDYMVTEDDLRRAIETAYLHCRPGGLALFVPDCIRETFAEGHDVGGNDGQDGRAVRFMEWSWDPDPDDTWTLTEYAFLLRESDGRVHSVHETHRLGLFARADWLRLVEAQGFAAEEVLEETTEDRTPRSFFVGHRPG